MSEDVGRHRLPELRGGQVRFFAREASPPGWFGPDGRISDIDGDLARWSWPGRCASGRLGMRARMVSFHPRSSVLRA